MFKILIRNSLILALGFFLSIYVLPEVLHVNETVSKYLLMIPAVIWITRSDDRWLLNMASIFLGLLGLAIVFIIFGFI
ncbi:hypothetical protein P4594_25045 [Priestia megaterium]|uniref:hypothetical protein n=1 Tax=Priestia megaterium TaxID=1404 RepID=UPI000BF7BC0F|nr:hypothetical protein [Priestia megaterium]MCR8867442.1 hypothetical protein [Priestia megaterium]MED3928318.1 hypothetical protein [Priestia megaterium]MED4030667.1 hypothetical protein [Priestia megaterium]PFQ76304.1 hypothetical protein COK11_26015 [Priestia megaterium]